MKTLLPNICIEHARPGVDASLIARLASSTFAQTFGTVFPAPVLQQHLARTFNEDQMTAELRSAKNEFLLAYTEDGEPMGYLKLIRFQPTPAAAAYPQAQLQRIYVEREYLQRGVGAPLLRRALDLARAEGFRMVWLEVWEGNERAIHFYQRHGFKPMDEQRLTVGGLEFDFYIMALAL